MMGKISSFAARLRADQAGAVVVETAIVAPVLVLLSLGTFDVSRMVAKHQELQTGATDLEGIVLAVSNGTATDTTTIKLALVNSLGLSATKVAVAKVYRCGTESQFVMLPTSCSDPALVSTYVIVRLTDTYTPVWTSFGVGGPINYNIVRSVEVS